MEKNIIAFWGCPKPELIEKTKQKYENAKFVDLDVDFNYPSKAGFIPDNYCSIIKNIINNALYLKDKIIEILAPIGKDKCDSAYFIAEILKKEGFRVVETSFEDKCPRINALKVPISKSNLPLRQKVNLITKNILDLKDFSYLEEIRPTFGFWGVPPNDFSILDLFPSSTAVYGWLRAVEAGFPGDWDVETLVDKDVPTVFYTQAFCSKTSVAKYLANKYSGLFIDADETASNSIKAKIEAFIKLR